MRFLIVDDSSTMRRMISNTLNGIGYADITMAEDGLDALDKMKQQQFDIILTDWSMPRMNGLEFLKVAQTLEGYQHIPIVMVTAEGGKQEVITAIKEGARDYIVKPFTAQVLKDKIQAIISI